MINIKSIIAYFFGATLVVGGIILAGSLTPSLTPDQQNFVTMENIYQKLRNQNYSLPTSHNISYSGQFLEWSSDQTPMEWSNAETACSSMGDGWRLPTKTELYAAFVNQFDENGVNPGNFQDGVAYWTGDRLTEDYGGMEINYSWDVIHSSGQIFLSGWGFIYNPMEFRCVRQVAQPVYGTMHTLGDVWNIIPTISAENILFGNSFMGIAGTYDITNLTPDKVKVGITYGTSSVGTFAVPICGDNMVTGVEQCDGENINGQDCTSQLGSGYMGTVTCNPGCLTFNTGSCAEAQTCGNDIREGTEVCDGTDLNSQTCESLIGAGYTGSISCNSGCTDFDVNSCVPPGFSCGDTVSYQGKNYSTIQIGSQCWFAQNLNVGTMISGTINNQGTNCTSIKKYCYNDDESNCNNDGGLYKSHQAMCGSNTPGTRGICPIGWHIPTHDEWTSLERTVCTSGTCATDFPYDSTTFGVTGTDEGTKLKIGGSSGFNAKLAGSQFDGYFDYLGEGGYYITSSYAYSTIYNVIYRSLWNSYNPAQIRRNERASEDYNYYGFGYSVRCIQN